MCLDGIVLKCNRAREVKNVSVLVGIGVGSDGNPALMPCAARLRHIAGTQWGTRKYLPLDEICRHEGEQLIV